MTQLFDTEPTPEGEQTLVPGVDPIDQRKRLETRQDQPLRGKAAPCDLGLFDTGARNQLDLF